MWEPADYDFPDEYEIEDWMAAKASNSLPTPSS
jgi:hypothetical protein